VSLLREHDENVALVGAWSDGNTFHVGAMSQGTFTPLHLAKGLVNMNALTPLAGGSIGW
jgi:hypothetical protein